MNSLDRETPRFDDGMVNIRELVRVMAESLVNEIMDVRAGDACADGNRCDGYRERAPVTSVGTINLRIPDQPAHPRARARELLPGGPAGPLLQGR